MTHPLFPLFIDLRGRRVLVVGGGTVALRKTGALLEAGAEVEVGAPQLEAELQAWAAEGRIRYRAGRFEPAWLDEVWLVVAATDDATVNESVAAAAAQRRLWANVVDDAERSSVQIPARVQRGPVQIAISSGGAAPMLARHLREELETRYDESLGALATLLTRMRPRIRARLRDVNARRQFFERLLAGPVPGLLRRGDERAARFGLLAELRRSSARLRGRVALVGAGPGDAGLLTLRGLRVLNEADVILHDRLVSPEVLALARRDALRIDVGKRAGAPGGADGHHATQQRIHALLLEHARAGRRVVRLKGGDSFVFGRGGEELEVLREHGIDFEVVPGITAALACAAYAGIPLTHRRLAHSLLFATAHGSANGPEVDWAALARPGQTTAFYMGVSELAPLRDRLIEHGRRPDTPFAIIENGSRPEQRVLVGRLDRLPEAALEHAVRSPALLIVGEVAACARELHWFGAPPVDSDASACHEPFHAQAA